MQGVRNRVVLWAGLLLLCCTTPALAGLHCSTEPYAPLPSQWGGFLSDWRLLRSLALPESTPPGTASPRAASDLRREYRQRVERLENQRRGGQFSPDDSADLGAFYLRLGEPQRALEVLRQAYQHHPRHFAIVANLGTAWQRLGNLEQAAVLLEQAVLLAPPRWRRFEEYHLRLVRQRLSRGKLVDVALDDLFGVRYAGADGFYDPGRLSAEQRQRLPEDALAIVQQLVLWLPDDAALVWQLAELAVVYGDYNTAGQLFDWLVTVARVSSSEVRTHRLAVRQRLAELANTPGQATVHQGHLPVRFRSRHPLLKNPLDTDSLPPIVRDGVNPLPWALLLETRLDEQFRPTFPQRLEQLHGCQVSITGFLQPLGEDLESRMFMLVEYPISCWYCEMPEPTGIVFVELPEGQTERWRPTLVKVVGQLRLNATDPEDFLFQIKNARIRDPD